MFLNLYFQMYFKRLYKCIYVIFKKEYSQFGYAAMMFFINKPVIYLSIYISVALLPRLYSEIR